MRKETKSPGGGRRYLRKKTVCRGREVEANNRSNWKIKGEEASWGAVLCRYWVLGGGGGIVGG